jgi:hypothetical protein
LFCEKIFGQEEEEEKEDGNESAAVRKCHGGT